MIQQILQALDAAAAQHLPVALRHLLTEQQPTGSGIAPHVYVGNGNWNPIANDNAGTFSYWRLMSPIREQEVDAPGCFDAFQATYNLRLVSMIDRDICGDVFDATRAAATAIRNTDDDLRAALKLMLVHFSSGSVEVQSSRVYNQEFGGGLDVNPNKTLVAIDVTISVTGRSSCFEPCTPTPDFFCALIEAKTWAKIKGCMTAGQIADAIEDLCDDAPCDPLSVRVNGEPYATVEDPCGGIASVEVVQGGVGVGELIGGQWVVPECPPCDDLSYTLVNTDDTELESGVVVDPCGASLNLVAPDADVTFDGLPVLSVPSGATGNLDCGTLLDAAYVEDGGSVTGTYLITGTLNGRNVYTLDGSHNLEYTGSRWRLVKPGSDVDAALGSETFPWLANWSATSVTVEQATIGAYCGGNEVPCADLTVTINDEAFTTVANPCGASLNVQVVNEDATAVGSLVGGQWVVPTAETLCALIGAATAEEISDCIIADGARADVLAELIPTVDDADVIAQIWDVMTPTQQDEILDNECPVAPANVLREYTTGGSWSKPTDASFQGVWVFAAGGGGSGGAGIVSTGAIYAGGSAGGGGSLVRLWVPAVSLLTTETYAIGAGATGPATGAGSAGGATLFGAHVEAKGGSGGVVGLAGGATARVGGAGGSALLNVPIASGISISGAAGGDGGRNVAGGAGGTGLLNTAAPGGGGGGGGNTGVGPFNGGAGGGAYQAGSLTAGGAGGVANGGSGTAGASDIYIDPFLGIVTVTIGIGTGGGGGAGNTGASAVAGNGADGGRAAGGGGGGSQGNGASGTRGAGGAGGNGFLLVYEMFAI